MMRAAHPPRTFIRLALSILRWSRWKSQPLLAAYVASSG